MSETIPAAAPVAPVAPVSPTPVTDAVPVTQAATPDPQTGTTPAAAAAPEAAAAPASSSSPEVGTSLVSEAKPAEEAPPPPEPAAVEPPAAAEPLPLPTYETFTLPENVTLGEKEMGDFTNILGEYEQKLAANPADIHTATQELGQRLVDLYIAESQATAQRAAEASHLTYTRMREQWISDFKADPQIGQARQADTLRRAGEVLDWYGQKRGAEHEKAFRDVMALTGAGDNPAVIRFLNEVAGFISESARPVPAQGVRAPVYGSKAERMYRNSIPTPGAA